MILVAIVVAYPAAVWAFRRHIRWLERRHRARHIRALLQADVDRIVDRPRVYDWACEGECPDCNPPAVDPLVEWERQIRTPGLVEWCAGEELGI